MIYLKQTVVVEGKYDKIKLSSILDANIVVTDGFRLFADPEKIEMLRALAARDGIIILTDSDTAGFKIRNYIKNCIGDRGEILHVYIPDLFGKEKRKKAPSKEGKLGVEGVSVEVIRKAFERAGILSQRENSGEKITKMDFYEDGLSGHDDSKALRGFVVQQLHLPQRMSVNALLGALNALMSREEYKQMMQKIKDQNGIS